jgi:hypothetical protein
LDRCGISSDQWVHGQKRDAFDQRLRDQEPVEGVFVKGWQSVNRHRVLPEDRQLLVAIVHQSAPQQPWIDAEVLPPEAALDRDLPEAGYAEYEDIVFLFQ